MLSAPRVILPLRILLVLAAAFSLAMLVLGVPGSFSRELSRTPDAAPTVWPILIGIELALLAFLLVIVCTWQLLTLVKRDRIFSEDAMRWVNLMVRTFVGVWLAGCVLSVYVTVLILVTDGPLDLGFSVMLFGAVVIGGVLVMIVAVLRALLHRATAMQQDLEEVI